MEGTTERTSPMLRVDGQRLAAPTASPSPPLTPVAAGAGVPAQRSAGRVVKSVLDWILAFVLLVLIGPFLLLIGLIVRVTSPGPATYRQIRIGQNGKPFMIWKFRTMVEGADQRLLEIQHLNEVDDVLFKAKQDPRITRFGGMLRRWSLDELPQLVNVLKGEMSLVGPRPPLPSEVKRYGEEARRRLDVKPGITGLWQVSGRSLLSWEESVRLDLHYVDNWSLALDLLLVLKTLRAVVVGAGAW